MAKVFYHWLKTFIIMGNLLMMKEMEKALLLTKKQRNYYSVETLKEIWKTEKDNKSKIKINIKEIFLEVEWMDREQWNLVMEMNILEIFMKIKEKEMGNTPIKMEMYIKAISLRVNLMDKENTHLQMDKN